MYPTFLIHSSIKRHQGCFHVLPCPFLRQKLRCRDTVTCPRPQDSGGIQISQQTCLLSCWLTAPLNLLLAICLETAVAHFCPLCCASSPAVLSQALCRALPVFQEVSAFPCHGNGPSPAPTRITFVNCLFPKMLWRV